MSNTTHTVTLTAKDGTKSTFDAIKRGAEQDAAALKAMGAAGAASGKQVASGAQQAESALQNQSTALRDVGIGMGALTGAFALAARAAGNQSRQIDAINRLYGESAGEILKLSEAIQQNTNYSNDSARQAAITGSTLAKNYGISAEQIGVLIERSANLARISGLDLADAMERVSSAVRGEGEAAELLGLNMSDAANASAAATAGITNWTTGATEAEKAAFRYQRVLEQTNATLGAAQEAHDTTAGTVRGLVNEVQDGAQAFAAWTGPVGSSVAVLSDYALQVGVAIGGVTTLATGIRALTVAQEASALAGAGATAASGRLLAVLGPVGIVAAAAAAAYGIYKLTQGTGKEYVDAAAAAESASQTLIVTLDKLAAAGNPDAAIGGAWLDALKAGMADASIQIDAIKAKQTELTGTSQPTAIGPNDTELAALEARLESLQGTIDDTAAAELALNDILTNTGVGADLAQQAAANLFKTFEQNGDVSALVAGLIAVDARLGEFDVTANKAKSTADKLAPSVRAIESAIGDLFAVKLSPELLADIETIKTLGSSDAKMALESFFNQYKTGGVTLDQFGVKVDGIADKVETLAGSTGRLTEEEIAAIDAQNRWRPQIEATAEAIDLQKARLEEAAAAAKGYAEALVGASSFASKLRPVDIDVRGGDKVTGQAANLQQTQAVLDSVLGTFQQLDSIGQASSQAEGIAVSLIGTPDELGIINRLVDQGRISTDEFNAAVKAGNAIGKEAGAIENDLNTIRAKQLPLLAESQAAYGNTIDEISRMTAEQQMAAIGFMDTNEAMKAQNAVALAAAAAQSEVGSAARESAAAIIEGAVAADPVLKEMLKSIGLVTEDKEGNIRINFENADSLNASTDALTAAITNLERAIRGLPPIDITETGAENVKGKLDNVTGSVSGIPTYWNTDITETGGDGTANTANVVAGAVAAIPGYTNTTITATDNASGTISYIGALMDGLNGRVSNVTVQTNYVAIGDGTGMSGGGMVTAAQGRLIGDAQRVRVNEGGPEMVTLPTGDDMWLPTGSMVTPSAASKMGRQGGRAGGGNNFYAPVYIQANNPQQLYDALRSGRIAEARA